jgi:ABC-2 type transport system permease protein
MMWLRLVRSEIRKVTTTKMPLAFLGVIALLAGVTGAAVVWGTDMDGSKGFIATAGDQQSLMAFAGNAFMGAALFGAVAVAREYGHNTVVPTYLVSPRRTRTVTAQLTAVMLGGAVLSIIGALLVGATVAVGLQFTDYGFLVSAGGVLRVAAASALCGAAGAALGAGLGALIRNTGGAVTAVVGLLFVVPPVLVQLTPDLADWIPSTLAWSISGVVPEPTVAMAVLGVALWALVPVLAGLISVQRRDVV